MQLKILSKQEQKIMEMLINSSQKKTKAIMSKFLRKYYKRVIETRDYIVAEGQIPVALVAHMDTVFEESIIRKGRELFYDENYNVMFCPYGAGFDDKAGIFAILKIIREGYRPHIILTTNEERGALGAMALAKLKCPFSDLKYMVQLDRRGGEDCVFYECDNRDFIDYVEKFGFTHNYGSFSDISELAPAWEVAAVNLSIGYRDEHSESEILFVTQMEATINKVKKMLDDAKTSSYFKYIPSLTRPYSSLFYGNWENDVSSIAACVGCKKYFLEEELFPVIMLDKSTKFCCPECLVDTVAWCNECGSAFQKYSPEAPAAGICPLCLELEEKKNAEKV